MKKIFLPLLFAAAAPLLHAQEGTGLPEWFPTLNGTLRAKGEWQPSEGEGRFEVRNARFSLTGDIFRAVGYKAEIDLSDEGRIRMLDAYGEIRPQAFCRKREGKADDLFLRIGQMRVPFSIDAHRSPHKQYFANRSFIAKQVGDVRDVGLMAAYYLPSAPLTLQAGLFNGSGLSDQKDYWTKAVNFSAKAEYAFPFGLTAQASVQKLSPTGGQVYLYDGGLTLTAGRWMLEGEYLRRHYAGGFPACNAVDAFIRYEQPLPRLIPKMSFLARFDMMDDHSDGIAGADGKLQLDDAARKRLTGGITLHLSEKPVADLRFNYEKYFYSQPALAKPSERDKAVVELMVHF